MPAARSPEPSPARPWANPWRSSAQPGSWSAKPRANSRTCYRLNPLIHHDMEPAEPGCDPSEDAAANPVIETAAKANELQPDLLRAVMRQESQLFSCAISEKDAQGLMQLMPSTAEQLAVPDVFKEYRDRREVSETVIRQIQRHPRPGARRVQCRPGLRGCTKLRGCDPKSLEKKERRQRAIALI